MQTKSATAALSYLMTHGPCDGQSVANGTSEPGLQAASDLRHQIFPCQPLSPPGAKAKAALAGRFQLLSPEDLTRTVHHLSPKVYGRLIANQRCQPTRETKSTSASTMALQGLYWGGVGVAACGTGMLLLHPACLGALLAVGLGGAATLPEYMRSTWAEVRNSLAPSPTPGCMDANTLALVSNAEVAHAVLYFLARRGFFGDAQSRSAKRWHPDAPTGHHWAHGKELRVLQLEGLEDSLRAYGQDTRHRQKFSLGRPERKAYEDMFRIVHAGNERLDALTRARELRAWAADRQKKLETATSRGCKWRLQEECATFQRRLTVLETAAEALLPSLLLCHGHTATATA